MSFTKTCPHCFSTIDSRAKVCPQCRKRLDTSSIKFQMGSLSLAAGLLSIPVAFFVDPFFCGVITVLLILTGLVLRK